MNTTKTTSNFKYYDLIMAAFVTVLICSNFIGPGKACRVLDFTFAAGNIFFPFSYIFGDVLTEVYGYARSRKVIWAGFGALIFATIMSSFIVHMPAALDDDYQKALDPAVRLLFGNSARLVGGSILAFWMGEFVNSYVMAKMKILTKGRYLWSRTIGSTIVGQSVDSIIFYPLAFYGIFSNELLITVMISNFLLKVLWEVICTPVTYKLVNWLKKAEGVDFYDTNTNFTPFALRDQ